MKIKSKILWTNNLEVNIKNKQIEATVTHSQLSSTNSFLDMQLNHPQANSLAVNIGFLLSQPNKHREYYVSMPIKVLGHKFFSMANSYVAQEYSAQSLEMRHILGRDNKIHINDTQINGPWYYYENSNKYYPQPFHHSEQAFYEYIIQRNNIDNIVKRLIEYGVQKDTVVEAVVMDMHSIRYVCGNCEIGGLALLNPNYNFISILSTALQDNGLQVEESLKIIPRVSSNKPAKGKKAPAEKHQDLDNSVLGTTILEADVDVYKLKNISTDLHNRSVFISSDISDNPKNYNNAFYNMLRDEYIEMLSNGREIIKKPIQYQINAHIYLNPQKMDNGLIKVQDNLFHSSKDMEDIEQTFYELSLIDKVDNKNYIQSDYELAVKIIKARQDLDDEIAVDNLKLTELKYKLLEANGDNTHIISLSTDALINMNILLEEYDIEIEDLAEIIENLNFIKILQNLPKSILELIANVLFLEETITIDEFVTMYDLYSNKFLNFMKDAYNSNLDINEDLQFYVELYMNKLDTDNISLILNYADLDQIKPLYNKSTQDFSDFISEVYEEEDLLEERGITDLFKLYIQVPQEDRWLLWEYLRGNSNPDKASTQRMDSYFNTNADISTDLSDNEYDIDLAGDILSF